MADLEIIDLKVSVNGNQILKGINLEVNRGEVAALMGPNGSGKTSLAYALMAHPRYKISSGMILFMGRDITLLSPTDRAKLGLFLSFQYPSEIPGVSIQNFLRTAYNSVKGRNVPVMEFHKSLLQKMSELGIDRQFASRHVNEGFSGGEKKRMEILQLSVLQPEIAILDETDSGLDVDSLKTVAFGINRLRDDMGILLITHYQRILNYIKPDKVNVMMNGKIVASGDQELAVDVERKGYDWLKQDEL